MIALFQRSIPESLPPELAGSLRTYRRRTVRWRFLMDASLTILIAGTVIWLCLLFDRFVDVAGQWRTPFPWVSGAVLLMLALRCGIRRFWRPDYDSVARTLDRAIDDSRDHLRTALAFAREERTETFFTQAAVRGAMTRWSAVPAAQFARNTRARRLACAALAFLALSVVLSQITYLRADLLWVRFLDPTGNHMRPSATWFAIDPLPSEPLRSGDDLTIRARLMGREVAGQTPVLKMVGEDGASTIRSLRRDADGMWCVALKNLRRPFAWRLLMADARSEQHRTVVLPRPTVERAEVTYTYPRYTGWKARSETLAGRTITALEGTRVKLKIKCNIRLAKAVGTIEEESLRFRVNRKQPTEAILHTILSKNRKMRLRLISTHDIESKQELPFTFRAIRDSIPSISLKNQLDGQSYYLTDTVEIEYRAQDDIGLVEIAVRAATTGGEPGRTTSAVIDVDLEEYGALVAEGKVRIPVADLGASASDRLLLRLVARDLKDQEGTSRSVTLKIAIDSFDRQLRSLLRSFHGDPRTHDLATRGLPAVDQHAQLVKTLRTVKGRLAVLLDALGEHGAVAEEQSEFVKQIQKQLGVLSPALVYGGYWFFDLQNAALLPRFRSDGEYANTWSRLGIPAHRLQQAFAKAVSSQNAKADLQGLATALEEPLARHERTAARVAAARTSIVRELVGYLAATLVDEAASAEDEQWLDEIFVVNCRSKLKEIIDRGREHLSGEIPAAALSSLETKASEADPKKGVTGALPALRQLEQELGGSSREAALRLEEPAGPQTWAAAMGDPVASLDPLATALCLEADNVETDELRVLDGCFRFLHVYGGRKAPYVPLGGRLQELRLREESAFRLLVALQRARAHAEEFRMGLATGRHARGQPELEDQWLRLREHGFDIERRAGARTHRDPASKRALATLLQLCRSFDGWGPPRDLALATLAQKLEQWEASCATLATALRPDVKSLLAKIRTDLSGRLGLLAPAIERQRVEIKAEITYLEKIEDADPRDRGHVQTIKSRLMALNTVVLKAIDFWELDAVYNGGGEPEQRLLAAYVLLGHALDYIERKIEPVTAFTHHTFKKYQAKTWLGKAREYEKVDAMLAPLPALFRSADQPGAQQDLEPLLAERNVLHLFKREREAIRRAILANRSPQDPKQFLADLAGSTDSSSAAWSEMYYRIYMIAEALKESREASSVPDEAGKLQARLESFKELPKELRMAAEVLAECREARSIGTEARAGLLSRLTDVLETMKPLVEIPEQKVAIHLGDHYGWFRTVDTGALTRAKIRSRRIMQRDRLRVQRALAAIALGWEGVDRTALCWVLGEGELNRRKAGLVLNRIGLGGIALSGDDLAGLNLPKHLYLELKRARARPMPLLYQEQCYDYLNRILEKARR